ncbi:ferritin family protein [uncultured Anaerococcus sp.]|uniref:ferritin family protein n=1 Tax=uncultured Anaerococcus sp. TaxID=293428 RepID=UPI0026342C31|nr:ferritin family protein [uncultured Anaerococcus sp.]
MYDPIKIINLAMGMELYGHNFYKDNAEKSQNLQTQAVFKKLSDIEWEHYEYLKNLLAKYKGDEVDSKKLSLPKEEADHFFDSRKESENLDENLEQSMIPDMNVLRMAYLIEEDFREYYKNMSEKTDDEKLKEILLNFASWEDGHAKIFKEEYDRLMDQYMNMSWGG